MKYIHTLSRYVIHTLQEYVNPICFFFIYNNKDNIKVAKIFIRNLEASDLFHCISFPFYP